jgi:hypothetical protein
LCVCADIRDAFQRYALVAVGYFEPFVIYEIHNLFAFTTNGRAYRFLRTLFRHQCVRCNGEHQCEIVLRRADTAELGAAGMAIRAGVDGVVRIDGVGGVARVAFATT